MTLGEDDRSAHIAMVRGRIVVDGNTCHEVALRRVTKIKVVDVVAGGNSTVTLSVSLVARREIPVVARLADGHDAVIAEGTAGDDSVTFHAEGVNLNAATTDTIDVTGGGMDAWTFDGREGDDTLKATPDAEEAERSVSGRSTSTRTAAVFRASATSPTVVGGPGDDTIYGDDNANILFGGDGNDTFYAQAGDDEVQGQGGNDTLWGGKGDDLLNGGAGNDREFGADHNDVFMQNDQAIYSTSGSPVAIPDGGNKWKTSTQGWSSITVPSGLGRIVDANVRIYVAHPDPASVRVDVFSRNDGKRKQVLLIDKRSNGSQQLLGTQFDSEAFTKISSAGTRHLVGRFHPEWSMEPVSGGDPAGTWELRVIDDKADGVTGTIEGWSLELTYENGADDGADFIRGGPGGYDLLDYASRLNPVNVTATGGNGADDGESAEGDDVGRDANGNTSPDIEAVYGGQVSDTIEGTPVRDDLRGMPGDDILKGGDGPDTLRGGNGRDRLDGGAHGDALFGLGNPDHMDGGPGWDRALYSYTSNPMTIDLRQQYDDPSTPEVDLTGYASDGDADNDDDRLLNVEYASGGPKDDTIHGNELANLIFGGGGNDAIYGYDGATNEKLEGGPGNDVLEGGAGPDTIDGGTDTDETSYSYSSTGMTIDLRAGSASDGAAGLDDDVLKGLENARGSTAGDEITGTIGSNDLKGAAGNDVLRGLDGNDNLQGGLDHDRLEGGEGADTLDGGDGDDTVDYGYSLTPLTIVLPALDDPTTTDVNETSQGSATGSGGDNDVLWTVENALGSAAADDITGNAVANVLHGAAGDDVLRGLAGDDTLDGGDGNDTAYGGDGVFDSCPNSETRDSCELTP